MKSLIIAFSVLFLVPVMATDAFAIIIFSEDFDGTVTGWDHRVTPANSHPPPPAGPPTVSNCPNSSTGDGLINQLSNGEDVSTGDWGYAGILYSVPDGVPILIACEKEFTAPATGNYDVSAFLGTQDCNSGIGECLITATLLIDGVPVFSAQGEDPPGAATNIHPSGVIQVPLTAGTHYVQIELTVVDTIGDPFFVSNGGYVAFVEDILIEANFPVGSVSLPIDSTALLVASDPSMPTWLAPLVLSTIIASIGLVLVRKN